MVYAEEPVGGPAEHRWHAWAAVQRLVSLSERPVSAKLAPSEQVGLMTGGRGIAPPRPDGRMSLSRPLTGAGLHNKRL